VPARGRQRRHSRKPATSAESALSKNTTDWRFGRRLGQLGRQ
jgi:hypothetical protein